MSKYLDDPKVRGVFTTILSGSSSSALHLASISLGLPSILSTIVTFYIFGSIIAYVLDILFAKQEFLIKGKSDAQKRLVSIPYSEIKFRFIWLLKSFMSKTFYKFLVTILIDTLIGIAILSALLRALNRAKIYFPLRDTIVAGLVALATFILYNNVLRFDWAYKDKVDPVVDMLVLTWASLVILIFALTYEKVTDERSKSMNDKEIEEGTHEEDEIDVPRPVRTSWLWKSF